MKKKIMFGLATIAALALPALAQAQDRDDRYRDRDRDRVQVIQTYVRPRNAYDPYVYVKGREHDRYVRERYEQRVRDRFCR